jgi:PAS domain S-box-containing protein
MSERGADTPGYRIHPDLSGLEDEFLRTIVGNTSEGLLTIDTDSTIVFANAAIEDILGYTPEELVGSSKLEIIPERLRPVHEQRLAQYIRTGEKHIDWDGVQLPALHKDGHEVPVTISLREHEFDDRLLFTGLFRDISDLKRKEDALTERNERLERFASVLSHDLRNPLSIAKSYAELLSEDVDRAELEEVVSALDRIDELVDDMLTLTGRADSSIETRQSVPIAEIATESWRWVDTREATLDVDDDAGTVRANRSRLGSLFENLFNNAVEHGGSDVTVRVGRLDAGDGFYVEDDGAGIPDGERDRILEHGFTTSSEGTGLGLSIVERIASEHGWSIDVTDGDGGGARFEFRV